MLKPYKPICWRPFCDIGMTYVPKSQGNNDKKDEYTKSSKSMHITWTMQAIKYNWLINLEKAFSLIQQTHHPNNQRNKIFNSKMVIKWLAAGKAKAKLDTCSHMIMLDNKRLQSKLQNLPTIARFIYY